MSVPYKENTRTDEAPFVPGWETALKAFVVHVIPSREVTFVAPYRSAGTFAAINTAVTSEVRPEHVFNMRAATLFWPDAINPEGRPEPTCMAFLTSPTVEVSRLSRFFFLSAQWKNSTAQWFETSSSAVTQSMAAFKFAEKNGLLSSLAIIKNIIAAVVGTALSGLRIDLDDESEPGAYPTIRLQVHLQGTVEQASECDDAIQRKIVDNVPAPHQMFFSLDYQFV